MHIDGACHCGAITYEAEIDPARVMVCHCTDCQVMGGGAFRWGVLVPAADFRLLRGAPAFYAKTGTSGATRHLAFCGACGTSLWGGDSEAPSVYSLRLSTARQARELAPSAQIWRRSALPWVDRLGEIPGVPEQRGL